MRRIAAVFDTGASSLYAHVANKEELLLLIFDRLCAEVPIPEPDPERWQEQIKLADAYESSLYREHGSSEVDMTAYWAVASEQLAAYHEDLPADRFPHLRKHARALIGGSGTERFEFGLDMPIDGSVKYVGK